MLLKQYFVVNFIALNAYTKKEGKSEVCDLSFYLKKLREKKNKSTSSKIGNNKCQSRNQ